MAAALPEKPVDWHRRRGSLVTVTLALALAVAAGLAAFEATAAAQYHSELLGISPCDGGLGVSFGCPPAIGAVFVQLGHGVASAGSYVYTFIVAPQYPPVVYADSLTVRAYNASSNSTLSLTSVTLSAPNGSFLVTYHVVSGIWSTASALAITEVDLLELTSTSNYTGEWISIWDSAALNGMKGPIS